MVLELSLQDFGVLGLAHVYLHEIQATVAQVGEIGLVELSFHLETFHVRKVRHLGQHEVAQCAGHADGDVEQFHFLSFLFFLLSQEVVERLVAECGVLH